MWEWIVNHGSFLLVMWFILSLPYGLFFGPFSALWKPVEKKVILDMRRPLGREGPRRITWKT